MSPVCRIFSIKLSSAVKGWSQDEGIKALQQNPLLHGGVVLNLEQGHGQAQAGGLGPAQAAHGRTL